MKTMFTGKINCSKIEKSRLFAGQTGQMMDCVIFIDSDRPDKYGNTMTILQSTKKDEPKLYLGNFTEYKPKPQTGPAQQAEPKSTQPERITAPDENPDDLPF